jgi:hypothetical protein
MNLKTVSTIKTDIVGFGSHGEQRLTHQWLARHQLIAL